MNRLEEIQKRKLEIKELLSGFDENLDLRALEKELDDLDQEERDINADIEKRNSAELEELKKRQENAENIQKNSLGKELEEKKEMEKKKFTIKSPEYRSAWAKKMLGLSEDKFTEEEIRALGDAVGTSATTYVASGASTQGINNGGLLIPTEIRTEILEIIEEQSPFYRDIRKLFVAANVDLPYLHNADDANWYAELTDTSNEGQEYKALKLTGFDLAKDVVVTWKLEAMAVEDFITFIEEEIAYKMGRALIHAVLYGTGTNQPIGALNGLSEIEGDNAIDTIIQTYKSLSNEARIGAKTYISTDVNIEIVGYKDSNGNYPFFAGIPASKLCPIEVDPYLEDGDILVGNPRNYVLNIVENLSIARETTIKGRKTTYGGFMIADGKPRTGMFAKGSYVPTVSEG